MTHPKRTRNCLFLPLRLALLQTQKKKCEKEKLVLMLEILMMRMMIVMQRSISFLWWRRKISWQTRRKERKKNTEWLMYQPASYASSSSSLLVGLFRDFLLPPPLVFKESRSLTRKKQETLMQMFLKEHLVIYLVMLNDEQSCWRWGYTCQFFPPPHFLVGENFLLYRSIISDTCHECFFLEKQHPLNHLSSSILSCYESNSPGKDRKSLILRIPMLTSCINSYSDSNKSFLLCQQNVVCHLLPILVTKRKRMKRDLSEL